MRELLLCQPIPDPPGDVDFSVFNEPSSQQLTARDRLKVHNSVASCAGCHRLTDDIGLSLENFDGAGQFRTTDAGQDIDPSGNLDGIDYDNQFGLADALRQNPAVPICVVQKAVAYGLARTPGRDEKDWLSHLFQEFAEEGYRFKPFLRKVASSDNFYSVRFPNAAGDGRIQLGVNLDSKKGSGTGPF